jgi:alkanesulfonate monooxygenase SsuD/methylene tetrahydromethanopterin reductase-like flavin-dependent oxidoreductase (luciferase family)
MSLKFGIFDHLERLNGVPLDRQYQDRLTLVSQADKAGFHCYHVAEHHHSPLCLAPNQAVYLSAVAQHTQRLLFGPLVYVLPLHHPVRLLEEICMADNMSGGRFQIGFGRGTGGGQEFAMWGGDPEENNERFEETFQILMRGFTNDFLSFEGKYYQFRDLWMELKPKQAPHPPFWYAGNPVHAAEFGANFIGNSPIDQLPEIAARYLESWQRQQEENDPMLPHVASPLYGASHQMFLADTDEEAVARARTAYADYSSHFDKPVPAGAKEQPRPAGPRGIYNPGMASFETVQERERLIVGSPSTVLEYVRRYDADSQCNYFVGSFQWGNITHEEASRSMELFATEVMPHFLEAQVSESAAA